MALGPLLAAPLSVQIHAGAALSAVLLGIVQMNAPKGTVPHGALGYVWAALMRLGRDVRVTRNINGRVRR